jgi:hypothetical protein
MIGKLNCSLPAAPVVGVSDAVGSTPNRHSVRYLSAPLTLALVALWSTLGAQPAAAQAGTLIADITCPDASGGVSVAFDGAFLYYTNFSGSVMHRIAIPGPGASTCAPPATPPTHLDFPIIGPPGLNAFSFDATSPTPQFWGAGGVTGRDIWTLTVPTTTSPVSTGMLQYTISPAQIGNCDTFACLTLIDGLAFDGTGSGSIWYSPDASQRVFHFDTAAGPLMSAIPLGSFDVHTPPNDMAPQCGFNYSSGVAAGASFLYLQADGCADYFQYDKTGIKLNFFPYGGQRAEDSECDNVTFTQKFPIGKEVIWVRDAFDGHIRAFEQPVGTCLLGGGVPPPVGKGRMTGGGDSVATLPMGSVVHQGLILHCSTTDNPNRLEVNWLDSSGNSNRFHLMSMDTARCTDDPTISPNPPDANFNTHQGTGTGRLNGVAGATVEWKFQDAGEPGALVDKLCLRIRPAPLAPSVLEVGSCPLIVVPLTAGDLQAHNQM